MTNVTDIFKNAVLPMISHKVVIKNATEEFVNGRYVQKNATGILTSARTYNVNGAMTFYLILDEKKEYDVTNREFEFD